MKHRNVICIACLVLLPAFLAEAAVLDVRITGASASGGPVVVSVYGSQADYDSSKPLATASVAAGVEGAASAVFTNLPAGGAYAVRAHQDVDGNGKLDRKGVGMPSEPFGFSNNFQPRFGPPPYNLLAFGLAADETAVQSIQLIPPRRRGEWALGAAALVKSQPYKDHGARFIAIPNISYIGPKLKVFGPIVSYTLVDIDEVEFGLTGMYRFDGYETDDGEIFEGLDDREDTFEVGAQVTYRFRPRWRLGAMLSQDVLDRHGGQRGDLTLRRSFELKKVMLTPEFNVEWLSGSYTAYYYGVPAEDAREDRPAYEPGDAFSARAGIAVTRPFGSAWLATGRVSLTRLSSEITDSPLVDESWEWSTLIAVTRSL